MNIESVVEYIRPYVKSVKVKKTDWLLVFGDKLICINNESSIMYVMDIIPTDIIICNTIENVLDNGQYMNYHMYYSISNKYNYIFNSSNNMSVQCEMDNLESDDIFSELLKLKSKQPMHKYILDNVYIPVFYGFLPVNKGDKLNIIGGYLEDNTILLKYTVIKKKLKKDIDIYLRLLPII